MNAPHVVIAVCPSLDGPGGKSPGKLIDMLERRKLRLDHLRMLLLDEADELLDRDSFAAGLKYIIRGLPRTGWQVGLFSATFTENSFYTARQITLDDKSTVEIRSEDSGGGRTSIRPSLQHRHVAVGERTEDIWERRAVACEDLCNHFASASNIIFARTRPQLEFLAEYFRADAQGSPFTVQLSRFKASNKTGARVLLATDSCGRGIDVQSVAVVINFEIPTQLENGQTCAAAERYVQRAGRAGRFGRCGLVVTLVDDVEEGVAGYSKGASMLEWLQRRTGLDIPALSSDLESLPGFGQARAPQEVDKVPPRVTAGAREEVKAAQESPAEDDAVEQPVALPIQPAIRSVLNWADEEEEGGQEKLEGALARASAAEAAAQEAHEAIEKLRTEYEERERALEFEISEVKALVAKHEMKLNDVNEEEEEQPSEEKPVLVGAVWCGGSAEEQPSEEEPVLVGAVWCGGSRDDGVAEEGDISGQDLVGSSLPSPLSTPASPTFSTQLSAESEEWIPVARGRSSNHSSNGSISTMTSTSDKSPGCVAVGAARMAKSMACRPKVTFGKERILPSKLVRGEKFIGKVVKVLRGSGGARCSGCFLTFGDEAGTCDKDGLARHIPGDIAVGDFFDVQVKEVCRKPNGGLKVELSLV
mmetsp:Transcript_26366/g.54290  ORF Transcript_26366/g.54290 Transcript_26366/m.54290 type:complete len:646 (-) Transcript_26366:288-2225(-)